jgi:4-hydroxy-tetrahydrodipicolinate synthase
MAYLDGDTEKARGMQLQMNPLVGALFCEVSPIPVKTALRLMGYDMGGFRLPLTDMEPENLERLKAELTAFGLIGA